MCELVGKVRELGGGGCAASLGAFATQGFRECTSVCLPDSWMNQVKCISKSFCAAVLAIALASCAGAAPSGMEQQEEHQCWSVAVLRGVCWQGMAVTWLEQVFS